MGTHWELEGHIVETLLELRKNEKKNPPPPNWKKEKKKARHLECTLGPSHWLHWLQQAVWEATIDHGRVAWQRAQALSTWYPNKRTEFEDHFANVWHRNKLLLYHGR